FDDGIGPAEVGVGGRHVVQALVVTSVVIMLDEGFDLGLKVTGQEVIFEQDAILEGLMPALDLALGLGMHRSAAHMAHFPGLDIFRHHPRCSSGHYPTAAEACAAPLRCRTPRPRARGPACR